MARFKYTGTNDFKITIDGNPCVGTVSVKLPEIKNKTIEVSTAGMAGNYTESILGKYEPITLSITNHTLDFEDWASLQKPGVHDVILRLANQGIDLSSGNIEVKPLIAEFKVRGAGFSADDVKANEASSVTADFNVLYYKLTQDGVVQFEIDVLNGKASALGEELSSSISAIING